MSHFPAHFFIPGVENAVCYRGGFTPEECDKIVEMGELLAFRQGGFTKGRVGEHVPGGAEDKQARDSDIVWLHPTNENDWVHHKLSHLVGRINHDKFQVDLTEFDGFQFSKYEVGGHYHWHIDTINEPPNARLHRKLSVSVILTDPTEYEGGELLLNRGGDQAKADSMKPMKGDVVVFYSFLPHMVAPVTKGTRLTLVTWVLGEKFR